jgi:hypothetical protein
MLPFKLEKGLLLEDRGILLPWGTHWQQLANLGSPSVTESHTGILFLWQCPHCLGGLSASVQTRLTQKRPLREVELHVTTPAETAQQTFDRVSTHLRGSFGEPSRSGTTEVDGFPVEEWRVPPITIWHLVAERFGVYHVLYIRHRGEIE